MQNLLKKFVFLIFKSFSKVGLFVFPNHYYSSISDINKLKKTKEVWAKKSALPAIKSDLDEFVENLRDICLPFQQEYIGNENYMNAVKNHFGPGYGFIEAQALHGFIRSKKPNRIVEVGSGVSTYCMLKAIDLNQRERERERRI